MPALSLYHWDFNRVPADSNPNFLTCSIAVFQWQPKASGKGLKKINACRVCGYMLTRNDVYEKAQEICDRLNAEGASVLSPPAWLQKTYSVSKPAALVIPRNSTDLPGSVVRSIRQRVMKQMLLPAGFIKARSGATYVRQSGDQIHLVNFQGLGGEYTINLGFHYAFLPPLFAGKKVELADYDLLDCGLRERTGAFAKSPQRGQDFKYGADRRRLESTLMRNAKECLRIFSSYARRFADSEQLLHDSGCKLNGRLIRPWRAEDEFAPLLALHLGRYGAAIAEVEKLINTNTGWAPYYDKLLAWMKKTRGKVTCRRGAGFSFVGEG